VPGEPVPERQGFGAVSMDITDYDASNFRRGYSFGASLGHSVSLNVFSYNLTRIFINELSTLVTYPC
jgi:hypothetical protein